MSHGLGKGVITSLTQMDHLRLEAASGLDRSFSTPITIYAAPVGDIAKTSLCLAVSTLSVALLSKVTKAVSVYVGNHPSTMSGQDQKSTIMIFRPHQATPLLSCILYLVQPRV